MYLFELSISNFALVGFEVAFAEALSQASTSTGVPSSLVGTNTGTLALAGGTAAGTGER
jgi:hypothetical protein